MHGELEFKHLQVLIVGGKPHAVRTLRMAFNLIGLNRIVVAADAALALNLLKAQYFDAMFCDELVDGIGDLPFVAAARRESGVLDHMIPIFLTCSAARRKEVEKARDIGVTDVLARPISAATVQRKLKTALVRPRSFIVAPDFFGPDRRARERPISAGNDRRARRARKVKLAKPASGGSDVLI